MLLDHKADVNITVSFGLTPLRSAIDTKFVDIEVLTLLISASADTNSRLVMEKAEVEVVQLLLNFKADVNIKNRDQLIPLFYAIIDNNFEVVQLLIDNGSDINSIDSTGFTPLNYSRDKKNHQIFCEEWCQYYQFRWAYTSYGFHLEI